MASDIVERLRTLQEARRAFVNARLAMNAARPNPISATPAERALYDERYQADHNAERALFEQAIRFAQWAADLDAAAHIESQNAALRKAREALEPFASMADVREGFREPDDSGFASTVIHGGTGDPRNGIPCDQSKLTVGDLRTARASLSTLNELLDSDNGK